MRRLFATEDALFFVVYQREPHAGQLGFRDVVQPRTMEERRALARRTREATGLRVPFLIDGLDDASRALFGDLPNAAILVGHDGRIEDKLPWAEPKLLARALRRLRSMDPDAAPLGPPPPPGGVVVRPYGPPVPPAAPQEGASPPTDRPRPSAAPDEGGKASGAPSRREGRVLPRCRGSARDDAR